MVPTPDVLASLIRESQRRRLALERGLPTPHSEAKSTRGRLLLTIAVVAVVLFLSL